jgi:magnesium-transporting ATPase (P-type)
MSIPDIGDESPWHSRPAQAAVAELGARASGLSSAEAAERLAKHGPNCLPVVAKRSALRRFLAHFHNLLIYVLMGSAVITATLGHVIDTGVIMAVVIVNAIIGFIQEGRAGTG